MLLSPDLCVVLVRTAGSINLGSVARLCGNLGVSQLRLVQPGPAPDDAEARMFAMHAGAFLARAVRYPSLQAALVDCDWAVATTARRRRRGAARPQLAPQMLAQAAVSRGARRWALVFGNEADGLNGTEFALCDASVQLASPGSDRSYNLSHAVAILLYLNLATPADAATATAPPPPTRASRQHLLDLWCATLTRAGYLGRLDPRRFIAQLGRRLAALQLSQGDVGALASMLTHLHRRLPEAPLRQPDGRPSRPT